MESKSAKYGLWGAVLAALITGAIALYIHYDGKSEKQKEVQEAIAADQAKETANLKVKEIYLPPINTRLDSAFFAEITNESRMDAENIEVSLNFGSASVTSCETLPVNAFTDRNTFDTSLVEFSYEKVKRKERLYVYCHLSNPAFESILITGDNLFSNVEYDRGDLVDSMTESNSSYMTFFKVIGSIVAVIFIAYFTVLLIMLVNKRVEKLGIKFE